MGETRRGSEAAGNPPRDKIGDALSAEEATAILDELNKLGIDDGQIMRDLGVTSSTIKWWRQGEVGPSRLASAALRKLLVEKKSVES